MVTEYSKYRNRFYYGGSGGINISSINELAGSFRSEIMPVIQSIPNDDFPAFATELSQLIQDEKIFESIKAVVDVLLDPLEEEARKIQLEHVSGAILGSGATLSSQLASKTED